MKRTILAGCLALVLALTLPLAAFAQEPVETTQATEIPESTEATLPTETTEATLPPEATAPAEVLTVPTFLEIDTEHIYPGMEQTYGEGYRPSVGNGRVRLVLPLLASGPVYQNQLTASLGLGNGPFVMANYEKAFSLETVTPENSTMPQSVFLISFDLALSDSRNNGVYPVTVTVSGFDLAGNPLSGSYTLYVTITDGVSLEVTPAPVVETPTAEPVVFISATSLSPKAPMAGEEFSLTVTLKNSLTTKSVRNLLVTVDTGNVHLRLLEGGQRFPD